MEWVEWMEWNGVTHTHTHQAVLKQSLIAPYEPHPRNATSLAYEIRIAGFSWECDKTRNSKREHASVKKSKARRTSRLQRHDMVHLLVGAEAEDYH